MREPIKPLPLSEVKVIKQIFLVTQNQFERDTSIGYIMYERIPGQDYKFKMDETENRDLLEPCPRQDEFPNDNLDDLILNTIRQRFPDSKIFNHFVIFSSDLKHIENLTSRPFENSTIEITLGRIDFLSQPMKYDVETMEIECKIYVESSSEQIKNLEFWCTFKTEMKDLIFPQIKNIKFI